MAEEGKSALFASHYRSICSEFSEQDALFRRGYSSLDFVTTAAELMERHAARVQSGQRPYDLYAMDVNLGNPNGYDFTAAHALYELIAPAVASDRVQFYPLTVSSAIVEAAKREGLPAMLKREFDALFFAIPIART